MNPRKMARRQIDKKLERIRSVASEFRGIDSWVHYIRQAYGMTVRQLAARAGVSKTAITRVEKGERQEQVTVRSLKVLAEALNCDLIVALVPREPVESFIRKQAEKKAREIIRASNLQMEMEDQAVSPEATEKQIGDLADRLELSKKLWEK